MNDHSVFFSTEELSSGELSGICIIEITSVPSASILVEANNPQKDFIYEYKKDFSNLLSEMYQNYRLAYDEHGRHKDICFEILWLTREAKNQPFNAQIDLFLIIRAIGSNETELFDTLNKLKNICLSTLQLEKYDFRLISYTDFFPHIRRVKEEQIRIIVKDERIENLQNRILPFCYAFDRFPETSQDLSKIVNAMIEYPDSVVSFQLIPTSYNPVEIDALEKMTNLLDTLSKGVHDQTIGNLSFTLAEKHAETYKYYVKNRNSALFNFNILIMGSKQAVTNISTLVFGHLNGASESSSRIKFLDLSSSDIQLTRNFYPLPWAVNELIIDTERSIDIWNHKGGFTNFYRFPYIITADEASEFFRLPIGTTRVSAGLVVNESGKTSRSYSSSIINGGDITVGVLKSSTRNDTIGFLLNDLPKHMLIVGTPGSGKTTFSIGLLDKLWKEFHIPFLVIEPAKNEYRALIQSIPDIQIFTPGKNLISPFIYNPFVPPKNVILESYKSTLKTAFSAAVIMSSPLDKIFEETIHNCYSNFRWMDTYTSSDRGKIFNISDFIKCFLETFENIGYVGEAKNIGRAGYVRLNNLVNLFDNYNTIPIEDILSKPTIIELAAIENSDQKALIIALLLLGILSFVNSNYLGDGNLKNIILLEEAHVLLDSISSAGEGEANPSTIAKGLIKRMLAEIRSYGVGLVIADQSPRKVTSDIVAHTNLKLVFRLVEAEDKEIIANSTNMTDAQVIRLAKLRPGEAFLFFDKLDEPEEVLTENYRANNKISITISDEEVKNRSLYWKNKLEILRPYPECTFIPTCPTQCNLTTRNQAREISRRIFNQHFTAETNDFQVLKDIYKKIERLTKSELNDEPFTEALASCVKLQLLRRVKYHTKINLSDQVIEETLRKIQPEESRSNDE